MPSAFFSLGKRTKDLPVPILQPTTYEMRKTTLLSFSQCLLFLVFLSSCRSITPSYNYRELARAGVTLGMDIEQEDNHRLYVEASKWIGTPYRNGGSNRKGVDCSGLTAALYNKVYKVKLQRSSDGQLKKDCRRISKRQLQEGDLVFFHGKRSRRTANHVGVYLKNNKFIHASSSQGVIVSDLDESYWKRYWLSGGRVK